MKALVFDGRNLSLAPTAPVPIPASDEALIRVQLAGVCDTDLQILAGYSQFRGIPGHEFVGVVIESPRQELLGKTVVGDINAACGTCSWCRAGEHHHCPDRSVLGIVNRQGAFAEYLTLPLNNLFVIPDGLTREQAVFCEPLAAAFEIPQQCHIHPGDDVLVLGDGKLGYLITAVLSRLTCNLTVLGKHSAKLDRISAHFPSCTCCTAIPSPSLGSYKVVIEATGRPEGAMLALSAVRPTGTIIQKSTVAKLDFFDLNSLVIKEITMIGSRCGPFAPALDLLSSGSIDIYPLIEEVYPLEKGCEALQHAARPGSGKILIDFGSEDASSAMKRRPKKLRKPGSFANDRQKHPKRTADGI